MEEQPYMVEILIKISFISHQLSLKNLTWTALLWNKRFLDPFCPSILTAIWKNWLKRSEENPNPLCFTVLAKMPRTSSILRVTHLQELLLSMMPSFKCWIVIYLLVESEIAAMEDTTEKADSSDSAIPRVFATRKLSMLTLSPQGSSPTMIQRRELFPSFSR